MQDCFFVESGVGKIKIDDKVLIMPAHSVLYINSGQEYQMLSCKAIYNIINFDFTDKFTYLQNPIPPVNSNSNVKCLENITLTDAECFDKYCYFPDMFPLQKYFSKITNIYEKKLHFYNQEISLLLALIIIKLQQNAIGHSSSDSKFDINLIVEYLHDHYNEEINNSILSEVFHFHPNYINSKFKQNTGKSIHNYILEIRILKSISMLESKQYSISEIANYCGFNNSNYFSRYFKKKMGITPSEYQKNQKNLNS